MSKMTKKSLVAISSLLGLTFLAGCGENDNAEHEHVFTNYVSNNDATCTKDGTKTAKCDKCDATDTQPDTDSKKAHSFTNYVSNNDATCVADGTKTAKCDNCDATDTKADVDSKKGHKFTNYVSNNDATCTRNATETAKCDNCDATDTREVANSVDNTKHSYSDNWSYDDNNHWKASSCGHADAKKDFGPHSFGEPVEVAPTPYAVGTRTRTCACGYSTVEEISNEELKFDNEVVDDKYFREAANCYEGTSYYYSNDNGDFGEEYFTLDDKLEHESLSFSIDEFGRAKLTCDDCGFDSTKDYKDAADDKLTTENISDILLNSSFDICYINSSTKKYEKYCVGERYQVYEYGTIDENGTLIPSSWNAYVFEQLDSDYFYVENWHSYNDVNEKELNYCEPMTREYFETDVYYYFGTIYLAKFDYKYDAESGYYVGSSGGQTCNVKIQNKQIVDMDFNGCTLCEPSSLESLYKESFTKVSCNVVGKDGFYGIEQFPSCTHTYVFHNAVGNEKAYIECPVCGWNSKDYIVNDLILNSRIALKQKGEELYCIYDDGIKIQVANDKTFGYQLYKEVGYLTYYFECDSDIAYSDSFAKNLLDVDFNLSPYADYFRDMGYCADIANLATANYTYDENTGKYVFDDEDYRVTVTLENNKIADIDVDYRENDEYCWKTDDRILTYFNDALIAELMKTPVCEYNANKWKYEFYNVSDAGAKTLIKSISSIDPYVFLYDVKQFLKEYATQLYADGIEFNGNMCEYYDLKNNYSGFDEFSPDWDAYYLYLENSGSSFTYEIECNDPYFTITVKDNTYGKHIDNEFVWIDAYGEIMPYSEKVNETITDGDIETTITYENTYSSYVGWVYGKKSEYVSNSLTYDEIIKEYKYNYDTNEYVLSVYSSTTYAEDGGFTSIAIEYAEDDFELEHYSRKEEYRYNGNYKLTYHELLQWDEDAQAVVGVSKQENIYDEDGTTLTKTINYDWNPETQSWVAQEE